MRRRSLVAVLVLALCPAIAHAVRVVKAGAVSPLLGQAIDRGRASGTGRHRIVVGLALRNREELEAFLADVHDPLSPRHGRFLTQDEFNALYTPTSAEEEALVAHLRASGLAVTDRYPNRLIVGATGTVAAIERAFGVEIHAVEHRGRRRFAAMSEPSFPEEMAASIVGVIGLDDLAERRPRIGAVEPAASLGTHCCALAPPDLALFYETASGYDGSGETIVIAGAYAWKDTDNTAFATQWGLPPLAPGSGQVCTGPSNSLGCKFSQQNSIEVALDAEYSHASAPGARILNYMAASTSLADFTQMYNRVVTDNPGHIVTTSWGACEAALPLATQQTDDAIFANANAIGQSWFAASGDNGSLDCNQLLTVDNPANSPHVMGVGGTTPTCSAGMTPGNTACAGYGSETGWSGSGGGVSQVFGRPAFQAGCGVPAGTQRLVPDVALEADPTPGNYVVRTAAGSLSDVRRRPAVGGLPRAARSEEGGTGFGNPGALLYGLCGTAAFRDVTSGSNGDYAAVPGTTS
jgi:kumamolisin